MAPIKINEEDKKAANLRVLQKADPSITEIIAVASHAVLYEFDAVSNAWEKRNVEGVLFDMTILYHWMVSFRLMMLYFKNWNECLLIFTKRMPESILIFTLKSTVYLSIG